MRNSENLKAIILAAGEGSRLRPYTADRPKCLVEIDGISLLDRQLKILATEAIKPIIIGGYCVEMLQRPDLELRTNSRYADTNMVWTLFCAEEKLTGDVLICYGDIVYSREILKKVLESDSDIAVAIDLDWEAYWRERNEDPLADAETLKMSSEGRLLEIGQKPESIKDVEGQYMGLIKFSNVGINQLKKTFNDAKNTGHLQGKSLENL